MNQTLKTPYLILLFTVTAILIFFTAWAGNVWQLRLFFLVYSLGLGYHLLFDTIKNQLFIWVFSMFIISSILNLLFYYEVARPRSNWYVLVSNSFSFLGFLFIFLKLFRDFPPKWEIGKRSLFVLLILAINVFFGFKIFQLVEKYNLSMEHLFYGFAFVVFKLLLLSVGLIFFFTRKHWSRKLWLLVGSFICFFLSDMVDVGYVLFLGNEQFPSAKILFSGLLCMGLCLFYMYGTSQKINEALENEKFI